MSIKTCKPAFVIILLGKQERRRKKQIACTSKGTLSGPNRGHEFWVSLRNLVPISFLSLSPTFVRDLCGVITYSHVLELTAGQRTSLSEADLHAM
jgi:hypothetical protein